jgi:adenylate cyclase
MTPRKDVVRRLSAIFVADLVGYTEQMRTDERSTHERVKADLAGLFAPKIEAYGGSVVKLMGDGLLAEFASVVDCVECARDVQPAIAAGQSQLPEHSRFKYRIAVNVGDVIVEPNEIYGDGVNLAVRLQAMGDPGGIILSDDAYRHVRGKIDAVFEDLGERTIRGVKEPVRAHRVVMETAERPPRELAQTASKSPLPGATPIAVLAFENLSGDPERSYFSDGITNDIVTDLSKFSELLVLAGHNIASGRRRTESVQDVSRNLGVRYLVEGSVQSDADRIRINIQLVDGASGRTLWAERYDRPIAEIFGLQDEIVQTVVATLVARVHQSEHQRILRNKPNNLEAYDVYLRGRAAYAAWTRETNLQAQELFKQAIELDGAFALAHGYLSYALVQSWIGGWERSPRVLDEAREFAHKAVDLGPSEFDNHWSLAWAHLFSRDFDRAMAAYGRACELNPNSPNLLVDMAEALVYVGRVDEAIANVRRAMKLNPMYPDWYLWTLGVALYHANEHEQAVAALTQGSPNNLARRILAASYARLGRLAEARRTAAEFLKSNPGYTLDQESVWPYRDRKMLDQLLADLRLAGMADATVGTEARGG